MVHPLSPNAKLVWQSLLPAIFIKSLWFVWNGEDLLLNLRSLLWGLIHTGVLGSWACHCVEHG